MGLTNFRALFVRCTDITAGHGIRNVVRDLAVGGGGGVLGVETDSLIDLIGNRREDAGLLNDLWWLVARQLIRDLLLNALVIRECVKVDVLKSWVWLLIVLVVLLVAVDHVVGDMRCLIHLLDAVAWLAGEVTLNVINLLWRLLAALSLHRGLRVRVGK